MLQLQFEPDTVVEKASDLLGLVKHRAKGDMERFKTFLEQNGCRVTGAWRRTVEQN